EVEVPYALPGHHYPLHGSWRLVRRPRHEGRVFSYCNLPTSQTLPPLRGGPETLSVYGSALRPLYGTEGFYEVHGSGGSRPSSTGGSGVPLPRRLAYPRQLQQPSPVAHSDGFEHVQAARPPTERRKVHFGANPEVRLHRGSAGLHPCPSISSRGSLSGPYSHHTRPSELPNVNGPLLPQSPRSHGVLHIRDGSRQVAPPTTPVMALLGIPATQRQLGPDFDGTIAGPSLPELVARPQEGAGRCSIPSTTAIPSLNHGCVIARLGSPLKGPPNTGPVVGAGIDPAHQRQGTASSTPCLPSLRPALTGSLCRHPHGQHNGHVLHQQARRGTLLPALPRSDTPVGLLHSPFHSPGCL
ncbi:hypothetical protein G0U57_001092, partial [Chelydra serpentina]